MVVDVTEVCKELEGLAAIFAAYDDPEEAARVAGVVFERGDLVYRTTLGPCKLKLVMGPTEQEILFRAERLKKAALKRQGTFSVKKRKPSLRRAKYSPAVAKSFLDDGEKDNGAAYEELFKE